MLRNGIVRNSMPYVAFLFGGYHGKAAERVSSVRTVVTTKKVNGMDHGIDTQWRTKMRLAVHDRMAIQKRRARGTEEPFAAEAASERRLGDSAAR